MKTHQATINGATVRYFYDRAIRSWTAFAIDADENQISPASYCANREELDSILREASEPQQH